MTISKIQFLITVLIIASIGYIAGFSHGKYYGANKELRKEINKLHRINNG